MDHRLRHGRKTPPPFSAAALGLCVAVRSTPPGWLHDLRFHLSLGVPSGDTESLPLQGPKGESVGSITQPLPSSYLIFRAASESDGESRRLAPCRSQGAAPARLRPHGVIDQVQAPSPAPEKEAPAVRGRAQGQLLASPSVSLSFPMGKCE